MLLHLSNCKVVPHPKLLRHGLLKLLHVAVGERQQQGKLFLVCVDKVFLFESSSNSVYFSYLKNQSLDQGDYFGNERKESSWNLYSDG